MSTTDDADQLPTMPQRNPAWRTETVMAIARGILMEDATDRYPILADALEEAGCDDYELLAKLRTEGADCGDVLEWLLNGDAVIETLLVSRPDQIRPQAPPVLHQDKRNRSLWPFMYLSFFAVLAMTRLVTTFSPPSPPKVEQDHFRPVNNTAPPKPTLPKIDPDLFKPLTNTPPHAQFMKVEIDGRQEWMLLRPDGTKTTLSTDPVEKK